MIESKRRFSIVVAIALLLVTEALQGKAVAAGPTIAVLDFSTKGLTSSGPSWYGSFEPGVALADLLTDALVNSDKFNVIDRTNLQAVLSEHKLSTSGEVSGSSAVESGKLIGARFLLTGNVLQFDKTGASGGVAGALVGGLTGGLVTGAKSERVTLKIQIRVIDAVSGQILQSYTDEQTQSGKSWGIGGFGGAGAGAYGNSQFTSSTMGHLINDEALRIAKVIDPDRLIAAEKTSIVSGQVVLVDGSTIVINVGAKSNVTVGMVFDAFKTREIKDPTSGNTLVTKIPAGQVKVISVSDDSSVVSVVSGSIVTGTQVELKR